MKLELKHLSTMSTIKGYKVFNPDFTCRGFQFEEGKEFIHEGEIKLCYSGFHFCKKAQECFSYYSFDPNNIVCEVEARGSIIEDDSSKACASRLFIIRKLSWEEVLELVNSGAYNTGCSNSGDSNSGDSNSGYRNSGDWNSGYRNSGDWNSGDRNSGYRNSGYRNSGDSNSGDWNSGDRNSGNWNSGDRNSGYRNSGDSNSGDWNSGDSNSGDRNSGNWNSGDRNSGDSNSGYRNSGAFCVDKNPVIWLFDKPTNIKIKDWERHEVIWIMKNYLETCIWIYSENMTNDQKQENPSYETTGGFLKRKTTHEAWGDMWGNLSDENKTVFLNLPNFDGDKFKEITGVDVSEYIKKS